MKRMNKSKRVLGVAVAAALVGTLALVPPASAAPATTDMFCEVPGQELAISPISGLKEGQAVTWLSTVKGTKPTEFTGEYVGKIANGLGYDANGKPRDLLLVKLGGDAVAKAGVWAGASGSPVYDADGALIGAVSYGFSWLPDDDVAGVTPAAYMKAIGDLPEAAKASPATLSKVNKLADVASPTRTVSSAQIRRIEPVRVSMGTTADTFDKISVRLAKRVKSYEPVAQGGLAIAGGALSGKDYPIVAGGNVAVSYAYGAVGSATVGTVTAVCGNDVFAYGHPNNWNSTLGASFHGASTARIVPDLGGSYKLVSAVGKAKGRVTDDRLAGLRGKLGKPAPSVPVTTVSKVGTHSSKAVSHVSLDLLVPDVAAAQLDSDATRMLDNAWEGSARVTWSIDYKRKKGVRGTLTNTNRYSASMAFPSAVGMDVATDIAALQGNEFENVKILGVKITARYSDGYRAARVTGVQQKKKGAWTKVRANSVTKVSRGKTYTFRAVLSPMPGAKKVTEYREFTVRVPNGAKKTITVSLGAPQPPFIEIPSEIPGEPPIQVPIEVPVDSLDALLASMDDNYRSDTIARTRAYESTGGNLYSKQNVLVTPTVIIDNGTTFDFKLQVPVKKTPKKKATPKKDAKKKTAKKPTSQAKG